MEIGKLPNEVLNKIVLNRLQQKRNEILVRPKIGEDCSVIDYGDYVCVLSTDPITGAVSRIGKLAVHISCNDIASCGIEPLGLLVTILAPPATTIEDFEKVMSELSETAASINVDIIGGHTEITEAVNKFVISCTAVGRALKSKYVTTSGAIPGDSILVTKTVGLEGTAIIAHDKEKELLGFLTEEELSEAKTFMDQISVIKEGVAAGAYGVSSMHDVTEGGILGALWELSRASGCGLKAFGEKIPLHDITLKTCRYYGIDPLKLISSGCMLITSNDGPGLKQHLSNMGIRAEIIGYMTDDNNMILINNGVETYIGEPEPDELYKVV